MLVVLGGSSLALSLREKELSPIDRNCVVDPRRNDDDNQHLRTPPTTAPAAHRLEINI
jgi:hypothetical protein